MLAAPTGPSAADQARDEHAASIRAARESKRETLPYVAPSATFYRASDVAERGKVLLAEIATLRAQHEGNRHERRKRAAMLKALYREVNSMVG